LDNLDKYIGYDIGAISVNRVILDSSKNIIDVLPYSRHYGEPVKLITKDIESLSKNNGLEKVAGIVFTGSGGKNLSILLGFNFINEIFIQQCKNSN
jgi:activator of 2-hydroxyglutaryl-CoA dehydratase